MIVNSAFDIYQMDSIFVVILYQGHTKIASQIWEKVSLNCEAPHANRYGDPGKPRQRCYLQGPAVRSCRSSANASTSIVELDRHNSRKPKLLRCRQLSP